MPSISRIRIDSGDIRNVPVGKIRQSPGKALSRQLTSAGRRGGARGRRSNRVGGPYRSGCAGIGSPVPCDDHGRVRDARWFLPLRVVAAGCADSKPCAARRGAARSRVTGPSPSMAVSTRCSCCDQVVVDGGGGILEQDLDEHGIRGRARSAVRKVSWPAGASNSTRSGRVTRRTDGGVEVRAVESRRVPDSPFRRSPIWCAGPGP